MIWITCMAKGLNGFVHKMGKMSMSNRLTQKHLKVNQKHLKDDMYRWHRLVIVCVQYKWTYYIDWCIKRVSHRNFRGLIRVNVVCFRFTSMGKLDLIGFWWIDVMNRRNEWVSVRVSYTEGYTIFYTWSVSWCDNG